MRRNQTFAFNFSRKESSKYATTSALGENLKERKQQ